jgi:hypothetical protein
MVLDYRAARDAIDLSTSATVSFWDELIVVAAEDSDEGER